jgi:hypothetical protein
MAIISQVGRFSRAIADRVDRFTSGDPEREEHDIRRRTRLKYLMSMRPDPLRLAWLAGGSLLGAAYLAVQRRYLIGAIVGLIGIGAAVALAVVVVQVRRHWHDASES